MKLWAIKYHGHSAKGIAISRGKNKEIALGYFQNELANTEPDLVDFNKNLTVNSVEEIRLGFSGCEILLNGDY